MPFAANGKISMVGFGGAIEITQEQYLHALEGMVNGLVVTIDGGFKVGPAPDAEPEPVPEPTPDEIMAGALAQRDHLLALAALRVAPLQDAVDLRTATAADIANLELWKQYRVDINRVSDQSGFPAAIDWPAPPEATPTA